ncbi:hypothetical protein [Tabrizicola sp. M-4]|uniref:hypothetical protein n=1 Tax=Tabrizicola sp. M-4 TaxID=3055847 RepID=UPI003DA910FC
MDQGQIDRAARKADPHIRRAMTTALESGVAPMFVAHRAVILGLALLAQSAPPAKRAAWLADMAKHMSNAALAIWEAEEAARKGS